MTRTRKLLHWLPVVIWMTLIFSASTDLGSIRHTSRIIGPFLRWLNPAVTEETISLVQLIVRKTAHLSEYAILAMLIWRALRLGREGCDVWKWNEFPTVALIAALYASTDEFHQLFVVTREATIRDVLIDTTGACAGLFAIWALGKVFKRW